MPSVEDSVNVIWSPTAQANRMEELEASRGAFDRLKAPELTAVQDADACAGATIAACSPMTMPTHKTRRVSVRQTGQW
jgi:hypothetical protein